MICHIPAAFSKTHSGLAVSCNFVKFFRTLVAPKVVFSNYLFFFLSSFNSVNIYLLTVNKRNTRKKSEICLKLTIKTPEPGYCRCFGVFIVNFEYSSHVF